VHHIKEEDSLQEKLIFLLEPSFRELDSILSVHPLLPMILREEYLLDRLQQDLQDPILTTSDLLQCNLRTTVLQHTERQHILNRRSLPLIPVKFLPVLIHVSVVLFYSKKNI
jgi:hypothetical protein